MMRLMTSRMVRISGRGYKGDKDGLGKTKNMKMVRNDEE